MTWELFKEFLPRLWKQPKFWRIAIPYFLMWTLLQFSEVVWRTALIFTVMGWVFHSHREWLIAAGVLAFTWLVTLYWPKIKTGK